MDDTTGGGDGSIKGAGGRATRILVLAPTSNDARLTADFLEKSGLEAVVCPHVADLGATMGEGCGLVLVAEEALVESCVNLLAETLLQQPSWSDLPLIIITGTGEPTRFRQRYLAALGPVANVSIVERPVRPATLVNACKVALRSRRRQYQVRDLLEEREAVLASISDGFLALDHDWRFTFLNAKVEALTGKRREDLLGKCIWEEFRQAENTPFYGRLHRAQREQQPQEFEYYHARLRRWLEVRVFPSLRGVSVYISDITERRQAEELLRESKARLEFALESAQVGEWDLDLVDNTSRRSMRHDQVFGYMKPVEKWGMDTFLQHVHPEDRTMVEGRLQSALADGGYWRFECRIIWPDRSVHWIAVHGSALRDRAGEPVRMLGIVMDITTRKEAEEVLLRQTEALRDADQRKDEFLAMLAHELRNPLASVANAATLIKSAEDPESHAWAAEVIERQTHQLAHLIDDLLDVSRITRGKIRLRKEIVDAAAVLDRARESAQPLMQERGHTLVCDYPKGVLWLEADPTRIEQIVLNLLTNAAKYTPAGGRIELTGVRQGRELLLIVKDNGIGIAPHRLPEMFELFTQGERSIARSEGGLGIGLTIVQKIAEMHGGRVEARSGGAHRGSTFTVHLPAAVAPVPRAEISAAPPLLPAKGRRVLVVDDNIPSAQGLARLLARAGHETSVAYDGPQALARAEEIRPQAVVLDIGLPGMDGYEVARRLRSEPSSRDALIIAVTGYGQEEDRQRSKEAGFDHHLVKPVDIAGLRQLLA
jgi:PAS domain S-box-containing protein